MSTMPYSQMMVAVSSLPQVIVLSRSPLIFSKYVFILILLLFFFSNCQYEVNCVNFCCLCKGVGHENYRLHSNFQASTSIEGTSLYYRFLLFRFVYIFGYILLLLFSFFFSTLREEMLP